jgi:hypothetical protein
MILPDETINWVRSLRKKQITADVLATHYRGSNDKLSKPKPKTWLPPHLLGELENGQSVASASRGTSAIGRQ